MTKKRLTIREVAKAAGVSVSTVSRVTSDHPDVKSGTRARVQALVDSLDYRPSLLARGMILKRTNSLGLVISDITNPFYPELAKAIEDAASERGWVVIVGNTERDGQRTNRYVDALLERSVDGIIFASVTVDDVVVPKLVATGYPVVVVNRRHPTLQTHMVIVDSVKGARMATEHLLGLGHRRIAHIAGENWVSNALERRQGYADALRGTGIEVCEDLIEKGDFSLEGGRAAMGRLLRLRPRPTAVFSSNDIMALGALEAIGEAGLRCPEDVAVVGFDDIRITGSRLIQLTTVSHRSYEMGTRAVEILLDVIDKGAPETPFQEVLEPHLIVRGTCGGWA